MRVRNTLVGARRLATTASAVLTATLLAMAAPAHAVTAFHVTGSLATGSDPVLLNEDTSFDVRDNENGTAIDSPLTIFFAVPVGETGPSVTQYDFDGGAFTTTGISLTSVGVWTPHTGSGGDLYTFVGCTACDNSINISNVDAVDGIGTKFNVYSLMISQSFSAQGDNELIDGLFAKGTLIAPLALDAKGKVADTSWTNTGDVNTFSVPPGPTPEPATWSLLLIGVGAIGVGLRINRRRNVPSLATA